MSQLGSEAGQRSACDLTLMECYLTSVKPVRASQPGTLSANLTAIRWFEKLVPAVQTMSFRDITNREMAMFRAAWIQQTKLAPQTFNKHLRHLRSIFSELVDQEELVKAPRCRPLPEDDPVVRIASGSELERLHASAEGANWPLPERSGVPAATYWRALIVTAYTTGLRKSDLLNVRAVDIDQKQRLLTYRACKTRKLRVIPVAQEALDQLAPLFRVRQPGQALFYSTKSRRQFYREWAAIQERAGILSKINVHDLRSTCGSMVYQTAGIYAASEMLAHSSIQITRKHYVATSIAAESLRQAVDQIPVIIRIQCQES